MTQDSNNPSSTILIASDSLECLVENQLEKEVYITKRYHSHGTDAFFEGAFNGMFKTWALPGIYFSKLIGIPTGSYRQATSITISNNHLHSYRIGTMTGIAFGIVSSPIGIPGAAFSDLLEFLD